ncbi:hypothetical protein CONLIGDRAFT_424861 [Coniochaeta ligniaria NRRL 30616]|uniref:Uncharacterized protein n=1 Tax=Coniochaeta ligniaria NRRL 30616 TaxID=1408157 RepID=A0A1J7J1Z2_9PEZI|nr:hypothetical protein CONLIGDRAFT_424861 [Coniochaeta ligniaria NRRL 30616]
MNAPYWTVVFVQLCQTPAEIRMMQRRARDGLSLLMAQGATSYLFTFVRHRQMRRPLNPTQPKSQCKSPPANLFAQCNKEGHASSPSLVADGGVQWWPANMSMEQC